MVLIASAAIFVMMTLFPPWQFTRDTPRGHSEKPGPYAFIMLGPEIEHPFEGVRIDITRLLLEWLALSAATGALLLWDRGDAPRQEADLGRVPQARTDLIDSAEPEPPPMARTSAVRPRFKAALFAFGAMAFVGALCQAFLAPILSPYFAQLAAGDAASVPREDLDVYLYLMTEGQRRDYAMLRTVFVLAISGTAYVVANIWMRRRLGIAAAAGERISDD